MDPLFGTLADFDALLAAAHAQGLRVILDLVPAHTSDQHPWFQEARSSRDAPRRDWYLWHDGAPGGGPPNNWLSRFGGPAWEWDAATGQYYLHSFAREQPDLNWRNPAVEAAMCDVMRFWLDRGVDGFRVDVMAGLLHDAQFRDNPPNPDWRPGMPAHLAFREVHSRNQPDAHAIIARMRRLVAAYPGDRVLIGELYVPVADLMRYYGPSLDEAHLPFNFQLITLPWNGRVLRAAVDEYEAALPRGAWPNWVLGNHDRPRIASRVGRPAARLAALLLLTLRGTPTWYYGDELGMEDVPVPPEQAHDPVARIALGKGLGRDPERSPMQWSAAPHAGFSTVTPWLPLAADYQEANVAAEQADPHSHLALVRALLALRRATPALHAGAYAPVDAGHPDIFAYLRTAGRDRVLVVLNLGTEASTCPLGGLGTTGTILAATGMARQGAVPLAAVPLGPHEGLVIRCAP